MLFKISNSYYVKVGNKYVKVIVDIDKNDEIVLIPTKEKIENSKSLIVKPVDLQKEKENIIKRLKTKYYNIEK